MIICKSCLNGNEKHKDAIFDYWDWYDTAEDFNDSHGRYCDVCGEEFEDGETVYLTADDM